MIKKYWWDKKWSKLTKILETTPKNDFKKKNLLQKLKTHLIFKLDVFKPRKEIKKNYLKMKFLKIGTEIRLFEKPKFWKLFKRGFAKIKLWQVRIKNKKNKGTCTSKMAHQRWPCT